MITISRRVDGVGLRWAHSGELPFVALADRLGLLPADQDRHRRMLTADWTPESPEVPNGSVWGCLATAVWTVRTTTNFPDAEMYDQQNGKPAPLWPVVTIAAKGVAEHVIARSRCGPTDPSNLTNSCAGCN